MVKYAYKYCNKETLLRHLVQTNMKPLRNTLEEPNICFITPSYIHNTRLV